MARNAEQVLGEIIGKQVIQIASLIAQVEAVSEQLAEAKKAAEAKAVSEQKA